MSSTFLFFLSIHPFHFPYFRPPVISPNNRHRPINARIEITNINLITKPSFEVALVTLANFLANCNKSSSGDEIVNVNFFYDDILNALQNIVRCWIFNTTQAAGSGAASGRGRVTLPRAASATPLSVVTK